MGMLNKYGHYCDEDSNPQNDKDARVLDELKEWLKEEIKHNHEITKNLALDNLLGREATNWSINQCKRTIDKIKELTISQLSVDSKVNQELQGE